MLGCASNCVYVGVYAEGAKEEMQHSFQLST